MIDYLLHLFDPAEPPSAMRGGALSTATGWFHFASDMSIFFAYGVLCTLLMIYLFRQKALPNRSTIWMILLFLLGCGITRLVAAAMLYYPAYRLLLVVKVLTAIVALITVFAVARIFPALLDLEGISRPRRKSAEESAEDGARDSFLEQRDQLEQRTTQLTVRDRRIRRALDSSASAACSWDIETNEILWEVGLKDLLAEQSPDGRLAQSWAEFFVTPECERIRAAARIASDSNSEMKLELPIRSSGVREGMVLIRAKPESHSPNGRSIVTGLVSFIPASVHA
jgi:hypothetical protein